MKVTLTIFGGNTLIMQHMLFVSLWMGNVKEGHSLNVIWTNELLLWTSQISELDVVLNEVSHCSFQLNV